MNEGGTNYRRRFTLLDKIKGAFVTLFYQQVPTCLFFILGMLSLDLWLNPGAPKLLGNPVFIGVVLAFFAAFAGRILCHTITVFIALIYDTIFLSQAAKVDAKQISENLKSWEAAAASITETQAAAAAFVYSFIPQNIFIAFIGVEMWYIWTRHVSILDVTALVTLCSISVYLVFTFVVFYRISEKAYDIGNKLEKEISDAKK